jgi:asparagine synthase (glutamine-hydrolysing)
MPTEPFDPVQAALDASCSDDGLNRMLNVDSLTQLPDDLLMLTDRMSMAVSLECRVPLLDEALVDLAATMPESIKVRGGRLKHLMKAALADLLPRDILERKKRGFGTPIGAWIKGELAGMLDIVLGERSLAQRGYFDPATVAQLVAAHRAQREDYTDALLAMMNFEIWARVYIDAREPADVAAELKAAA